MRPLALLSLLLLFSFGVARGGEDVPFRLVNGFVLIKGTIAGRAEPLTLLVDSGASTSVLDLKAARRLRLALGSRESVQGVGMEAAAYRLSKVGFALGGPSVDEAQLALDLSTAVELCGERVDGLLGAGFFSQRAIQIDYRTRRLRLLDKAEAGDTAAIRLPLRKQNGVFCAPVSVNGSQDRWLRVDTGCNDELHWVVARTKEKRPRRATIGFVDDEQNVTKAQVKLGGKELTDVETSLHGRSLFPGEAGLLGNGLLSRYIVTFDGPGGALWLHE